MSGARTEQRVREWLPPWSSRCWSAPPGCGAALVVLLAIGTASEAQAAGFGEAPLSASAAELRRAEAAAERSDDTGVTWLLDEGVYRVESSGATTSRYRCIVVINSTAGVSTWQTFSGAWSPWFQDQPTLQARVLDGSDRFHELDPRTVDVGPPPSGESHMVSDRRLLRAPLPALAPGAIVEIVLTVRERKPLFAAGSVRNHSFGRTDQPVSQSRVIIDAPAGMRLAIEERLHGLIKRRVEERAGRTRRVYEATRLPAFPIDYQVPGDVSVFPSVGLSTGTSWDAVARAYAAVVRRQIAAGPLPAEARIPRGRSRLETIRHATDLVRRELRYTGLELGENEIAPWTPAEVWRRRYGDCKDLSTFLVALLAGAGIEARVALLDSGPGEDLAAALPGLGMVDHAIVYVPSEKLWIDPTVELARPGQLPSHVQGRLAVIASERGGAPVHIPAVLAAENGITEDRRIAVADMGAGSVVEVARYRGLRELSARYAFRDTAPSPTQRNLEDYVKANYAARKLARHRLSPTGELANPFTLDLVAEEAEVAYTMEDVATVWIDIGQLFQLLPDDLRQHASASGARRAEPAGKSSPPSRLPRALEPHMVEWRYVIALPDGFETVAVPAAVERSFAGARFSQKFVASAGEIRGHLRFTLSRDRLDPKQLQELKQGVSTLLAAPRPTFRFESRATRLVQAGDLARGLAEARRLVDAAPKNWGRLARLAYVAGEAGLAREAVAAARRAVEAAPATAWAHGALAAALRRDPVGRLDAPGFDRRAAIAALEKAAALAPDVPHYQIQLGVLHSLGDDAVYLGGDLASAARALEKARELGDTSHDGKLLQVLLRRGEVGKVRELADRIEPAELAGAFRLAGARNDGEFKEALAQIASASRAEAVQAFSLTSLQIGHHDGFRRASRLARDSLLGNRASQDILAGLRSVPAEPKTIADLLALFIAEAALAPRNRWLSRDLASAGELGDLRWPVSDELIIDPSRSLVLPARQIYADYAASGFELHPFGRAGAVEAINVKFRGQAFTHRFYVSHEGAGGRELRLLGVPGTPQFLGPSVLRAVDAGRLADARRILDWAAGDPAAAVSRNFVGQQLSRFWNRGQRGDRRRLRLAAAGLMLPFRAAQSLTILDRECRFAKELAEACRMARVAALVHLGRFGEADDLIRRLSAKPDPDFLDLKVMNLVDARAWTEIEKLAAGKHPAHTEHLLQYAMALAWLGRGQPARARAVADAIRGGPAWNKPWSANNVAFLLLFTGATAAELGALVPDLERLYRMQPGINLHHTLACYYAVLGKHREARDALHQIAVARPGSQSIDQLVVGRLAAAAGLTAAARRAYEEVLANPRGDRGPGSSVDLARRWLAELPGAK